jgi:hypothetical protein
MKKSRNLWLAWMACLLAMLACNLPAGTPPPASPPSAAPQNLPTLIPPATFTAAIPLTETATLVPFTPTTPVQHVTLPSNTPPGGRLVYDVISADTAAEKRAPYGDSYDINRLERPFQQDMTYLPDLDIATYTVSEDSNFWYVSIELIGTDPNNALGIHYGMELDRDHDGFGDFILWASPPYTPAWDTLPVRVFEDRNHNTGGLSGELSDAPLTTDGYETRIFNGGVGDADPDLAWVRVNAGREATVQFAFKKSWAGSVFMLGVIADAGLRDVTKLDYVDRFTEEEAGSPVKDKRYYPLKALFAVDNACREAFGFKPTGYEPQLCPRDPQPQAKRTPNACQPPPYCYVWDPIHCICLQ